MRIKVMKSRRNLTLSLAFAMSVTACARPVPSDPESFLQSASTMNYEAAVSQGENGDYFRVAGSSRQDAIASIVARLTAAGATNLRANPDAGNVTGAFASGFAIDCGAFEVIAGKHRTRLAATTADLALPTGTDGLDRREFQSQSTFTVHVMGLAEAPGFAARVAERHRVHVTWTPITRTGAAKEFRTQFAGDEVGSLGAQETCRSSGSIRRMLSLP